MWNTFWRFVKCWFPRVYKQNAPKRKNSFAPLHPRPHSEASQMKTATKPATVPNLTFSIVATFATVAEAVAASKMDLSYNPREAKSKISQLDTPHRSGKVESAFLLSDGSVWYIFQCDIRLLNKFDPFISCLHDGAFFPVLESVKGEKFEVVRSIALPRNARKQIAKASLLVTTL